MLANAVRQLQAWRGARSRGQGMEHLLAMRRAEQALKRKREMDRLGQAGEPQSFAQNRAKQLKSWRLRIAGQGNAGDGWRTVRATPEKNSGLSATRMAAAASRAGAR